MKRSDVYKYLDTEREYQDLRWGSQKNGNDIPDEEKPIPEWINYMEYHLMKAKEMTRSFDYKAALNEVRKVTALGVRCMELYGCPERIIPDELLNKK